MSTICLACAYHCAFLRPVNETKRLQLPKRKVPATSKRGFNLYLNQPLAVRAAKLIDDRYELSLSEYINGILAREVELAEGLLHAQVKTHVPSHG
jgi:hypothetical protein